MGINIDKLALGQLEYDLLPFITNNMIFYCLDDETIYTEYSTIEEIIDSLPDFNDYYKEAIL